MTSGRSGGGSRRWILDIVSEGREKNPFLPPKKDKHIDRTSQAADSPSMSDDLFHEFAILKIESSKNIDKLQLSTKAPEPTSLDALRYPRLGRVTLILRIRTLVNGTVLE